MITPAYHPLDCYNDYSMEHVGSIDEFSTDTTENRKVQKRKAAIAKFVPAAVRKEREPQLVARRNARERKRVQLVNDGFLRLRRHVPTQPKNKKLSKVKTLQSAIDYILHLQQVLQESGADMKQVTALAAQSLQQHQAAMLEMSEYQWLMGDFYAQNMDPDDEMYI